MSTQENSDLPFNIVVELATDDSGTNDIFVQKITIDCAPALKTIDEMKELIDKILDFGKAKFTEEQMYLRFNFEI